MWFWVNGMDWGGGRKISLSHVIGKVIVQLLAYCVLWLLKISVLKLSDHQNLASVYPNEAQQ